MPVPRTVIGLKSPAFSVLRSRRNRAGRPVPAAKPSRQAEVSIRLQFGQLDLAVAAIRRRRRLFNGKASGSCTNGSRKTRFSFK